MDEILSNILFIGKGLSVTLLLLLGSLALGFFLAVWAAVLRYKKILLRPLNRIISILRGTPLILQLALVYFSTPNLLGIKLSIVSAGVITFGLNSFAYLAEILRAGIESLPKGQFEAAKVLEIPDFYAWRSIILPQVFRTILPALIGEVVALLKETAIISTIGGLDIMRSAQILAAEQFTYFMPLFIAGIYYYLLVLLIEWIGKKIRQRWHHALS